MNELYSIVETIINQGSQESIDQLIQSLNQNPGEPSKDYLCGENVFYVVKRFVTASLARDPKIKQNVLRAMTNIDSTVANLSTISKPTFQQFFLTSTDMTDCKTKQQKAAYIQGKINVVKAFTNLLTSSDKIVSHLVQLTNENDHLQEELIEAIYILVGDNKIKGVKFTNVQEGTNAKALVNILNKKTISQKTIQAILVSAMNDYPKESITIKYLGLNLSTILPTPSQFFTSEFAQFTNTSQQQTEDGDLKKLYYLLWIQKYFLQSVVISPQNVNKFLSTEMAVVWLEQLRVKNKHMRKAAGQITIKFQDNAEFSFQVLKLLHDKKVYLQNISQNHPFAQLYSNLDTVKFWTYLVQLINSSEPSENKDQIIEQEEEAKLAKREEYLSELQYLTREKVTDLTPELIGQSLTILIKAYQQSKRSEKLINLVWSLFHSLLMKNQLKKKSKKKIVLNLRGPLILSKINLTSLELESEIVEIFNKVIKFLRLKAKAYKQQENPDKLMIAFLNFVTGLIVYCIVYPEEADVCGEIEFLFKDLEVLVRNEKGTGNVQVEKKKTKKQQKNEEPEDLKKPVHVLVDVFISLLTKAPIFLRNSINLVFEQLVPLVERSDLDTLLDVILKPDQEYIEEI